MLTRRLLRIKVLQTAYQFELQRNVALTSDPLPPEEALRYLEQNIAYYHQLQTFLLFTLAAFTQRAQRLVEEEVAKHLPNAELIKLLNPLAKNALFLAIGKSNTLDNDMAKEWWTDTDSPAFMQIFHEFLKTDAYKNYVAEFTVEKSKHFPQAKQLVKDYFDWLFKEWYQELEHEELAIENAQQYQTQAPLGKSNFQKLFINAPITYCVDIHFAMKDILDRLEQLRDFPMPETRLLPKPLVEEELQYAKSLLVKKLHNSVEHQQLIAQNLHNWQLDRLKKTDLLVLELGITELIYFPDIPTRVTLNEYVDIANLFGANEALPFINGVLDNILRQLEAKGRIQKNYNAQ